MSEMLAEIGGGDVEIKGKGKVEEAGREEGVEKSESIVETKPKEPRKSKKNGTKKSVARKKDRDYTSTMVRKDTVNLIKLMFPDDSIQDAVDSILTEWLDKNEKNIEQMVRRSLKRKKQGKKS